MPEVVENGRTILKDSDDQWVRNPFQVTLGEEFTTMSQSLKYLADIHGNKVKHGGNNDYSSVGSSTDDLAEYFGMPDQGYLGRPYFKDTRLGANDAINCLWQFNRDDDIVHPLNQTDVNGIGMGRVYAQTIEQNQTIAWFTMGVPKFTNLKDFYLDAFNADLIKLNNTGFTDVSLTRIFSTLGMLALAIPTLPLRWLHGFFNRLRQYNIARFCELRTTMHLYYKYVDSILTTWLVNTGVYGTGGDEDGKARDTSYFADPNRLPMAIRETGPSIWDIMRRKATMIGQNAGTSGQTKNQILSLEQFEDEVSSLVAMSPKSYDKDTDGIAAKWSGYDVDWSTMMMQCAYGATQFVGFRIEKSVDASETFSNSTGPSQFAEQINQQVQEKSANVYDMGGYGNESRTGIGFIDGLLDAAASVVNGVSSLFGVKNLATAALGGAMLDVPEQYKSSDFSKSHSLNFQLRAPMGTIDCIYQSIMVPLCMLLAMALPRQAGRNSYMQPFFIRVYCKGMFSIPYGIIDSLTIKRGSSEFGWTYQNLPTCVDVSMSIKDLSPIMYMGIKDNIFDNIFGTENAFEEYLLTLAGVGLWDRMSRWKHLVRQVQILSHRMRNTVFNPMMYASWVSDTTPVQAVAGLLPFTRIPSN